jgi:hypothetical protein
MSRPFLAAIGLALLAPAASGVPDARHDAPPEGAAPAREAGPAEPDALGHIRVARRDVFVCREPAVTVYSDRPCGELALKRELVLRIPELPAGKAPSTEALPAKAATLPRVEAAAGSRDPKADARARCRQLNDAIETVNERMRAGYSAREAPRLWQRWRDAHDRLREADC